MAEQVLAAVRTGPGTTELREFPMPEIPDDGALLQGRGRRDLRHRREDVRASRRSPTR